MPLARFDGHFPLTYPDHRDAETGTTLTAVPGESYTVLPAVPADGRWSSVPKPRKRAAAARPAAGNPAAKTAPSPESEG